MIVSPHGGISSNVLFSNDGAAALLLVQFSATQLHLASIPNVILKSAMQVGPGDAQRRGAKDTHIYPWLTWLMVRYWLGTGNQVLRQHCNCLQSLFCLTWGSFYFRIRYKTWWFTFYSLLIELNTVSLIESNCWSCYFLCICLQPSSQNKRWVYAVMQHARKHSFWNFDVLSCCVIYVCVLTTSRGFVFALFWIKFSTSHLHQRSHWNADSTLSESTHPSA